MAHPNNISKSHKRMPTTITTNTTPNVVCVVSCFVGQVTFLSSNAWDVSGGGNYGYNSIWVNRNENIFDNLDYDPKYKIKNLSELLALI